MSGLRPGGASAAAFGRAAKPSPSKRPALQPLMPNGSTVTTVTRGSKKSNDIDDTRPKQQASSRARGGSGGGGAPSPSPSFPAAAAANDRGGGGVDEDVLMGPDGSYLPLMTRGGGGGSSLHDLAADDKRKVAKLIRQVVEYAEVGAMHVDSP
jgi:hypothetical protein